MKNRYIYKYYTFLAIFSFTLFSTIEGKASHLVGADMSLTCLGGNQYQIDLVLYRDCDGQAAPTLCNIYYSSANCGQSLNTTIYPISGTGLDISPVCASLTTKCDVPKGSYPGIQKWEYRGTITLPASCNDWVFYWDRCCRNGAITNIFTPSSESMRIESMINNLDAPCNSTPSFSNDPVSFICTNQFFTYNHGATDIDGDSLVYTLIAPKTGAGTTVSYKPGWSATNPLTSVPPLSLNSLTGDISITPTNLEITVMAVLVEEYRNGILIGSVIRDIQVYVQNCPNNDLPTLSGINGDTVYEMSTCADAPFCFNINSSDPDTGQTLTMTWNGGIPSPATFNISAPGPSPTGTFCWTPDTSDVSSFPHSFTVSITDDACPYNGFQTFSYNIYVSNCVNVSLGTDLVYHCSDTNIISSTVTGGVGPLTYVWSTGSSDTAIIINDTGTYWLTVTDSIGSMGTDTIQVIKDVNANFTSPPVCDGDSSNFTSTSSSSAGPIVSWQWDFGEGNYSNDENPSITFSNPGSYTVSLIVSDTNDCYDSISRTYYVYVQPIANFNYTYSCGGDSIPFSNNSIGPIVSWDWNFGDGNTSTLQNPSHLYSSYGTYNVVLTVTTDSGCTDIYSDSVVFEEPGANFGINDTLFCTGDLVQFYDSSTGTIISWNWDFGDGNTSTSANPTHTYATEDTFNVRLIISGNACTDTMIKTLIVVEKVIADFYAQDLCVLAATQFTDISTGAVTSWKWHFGDGDSSDLQNPTHKYVLPGTYAVSLRADNGVCPGTVINVISILDRPTAAYFSDETCDGDTAIFTDLSDSTDNGPVTSWSWDFGDGNTDNSRHTSHLYGNAGTYPVTLIVADSVCTDTLVKNIIIREIPVAAYSYNSACAEIPTQFTDNSLGNPIQWRWDFGDGNTDTIQHPSHIYTSRGDFIVKLIVYSIYCVDSVTDTVHIWHVPNSDFNSNAPVCLDDTVRFLDQSTDILSAIVNWNWDFGDGFTSTDQDPLHLYTNDGTYYVTLITTNAYTCSDTLTDTLTVFPKISADFNATTDSICAGKGIAFNDLTVGPTILWDWDFGDGNVSAMQNPSHVYQDSGSKTVTLIASTGYCNDTITKSIDVLPGVIANFTHDQSCANSFTLFEDSSIGIPVSWNWDFGDGGSEIVSDPSHKYVFPGIYPVTLIVSNNICNDTITKPVEVFNQPLAAFIAPDVCDGDTMFFVSNSFAANGSINSWNWDFGDGILGTGKNTTHFYDSAGTYLVTLVVSDSLCIDTLEKAVFVRQQIVAGFNYTTVCAGTPTQFTDLSAENPVQWSWNFGDGGSDTLSNPKHTYTTGGTYKVKLNVFNGYCWDSDSLNIISLPSPVADFSSNSPVCLNDSTRFTDSSTTLPGNPIINRQWSFGDGDSAFIQSPVHLYADSGKYVVSLATMNIIGCSDTITKIVQTYPPIEAFFSYLPDLVCQYEEVAFNDSSIGYPSSWDWDLGLGSVSTERNPTAIFNQEGFYTVSLTVSNDVCGSDSVEDIIQVIPMPVVALIDDTLTCLETPLLLSPQVDGDTYLWSTGAASSSITLTGKPEDKEIIVWLAVTKDGCTSSDTLKVTNECDDILYLPNAFTPNGDMKNDIFYVYGKNVKEIVFFIHDRWGEKVFESHSMDIGWDGKLKGKEMNSGIFIVTGNVRYHDDTSEKFIQKIRLIK